MGVQYSTLEESIGNVENPESQFSGAPRNAEQGLKEASPLSEDARKIYEHLIVVQIACLHAYNDPDMTTPERHQQTIQDLNNQCARHALAAHSRDNPADADTTVIQQQIAPSGSSEVHHHGGRGRRNNTTSSRQQRMVALMANTTLRLMDLKGQVADSCATCGGSHTVQQAIDVATPQQIIMVREEMLPCVRMLAVHVFGNHVVQKILEHGPQFWKRKLISRLIGHVFPLSLHVHGCQVIQKALEVGAPDQKVEEEQVALLVSVARRNVVYLTWYPHGRHVAAAIERFLTAKAGRPVVVLPPSLPLTPPL